MISCFFLKTSFDRTGFRKVKALDTVGEIIEKLEIEYSKTLSSHLSDTSEFFEVNRAVKN